MLENNKKEQLIGSILDELKELELLTQGMQDPRMLQELAIKKAQHLLANYELLKEADNAPCSTVSQPKQTVVPEVKPVENTAPASTTSVAVKEPATVVVEKEQPKVAATIENKVEQPEVAATKPKQEAVAQQEEIKAQQNDATPLQRAKEGASQINNDRFKATTNTTAGINSSPVKRVDSIFVKSLKSALKLNDRIRYSRELFGGSTELLNSTIEELDQKSNLGEALAYINAQFNWDKDNEAVIEFLSLLERRF